MPGRSTRHVAMLLLRRPAAAAAAAARLLPTPGSVVSLTRGLAKKSKGKGGKGGGKGGGGKAKANTGAAIITLQQVTKAIPGGRVLLDNVSMGLLDGAKVGVLGANGCGKSSMLKLLAGIDTDFHGTIWRQPGLRMGLLEQEPELDDSRTVIDNIMDGVSVQRDALQTVDRVTEKLEDSASLEPDAVEALLQEQAEALAVIERLDCWQLKNEVQTAMAALNCPAPGVLPTHLSGGQRRRVALCRLLVSKPDILMLDEPTNHLDASSVAWLEGYLAAYKGAVVAVTHDRYFLDSVAFHTLHTLHT